MNKKSHKHYGKSVPESCKVHRSYKTETKTGEIRPNTDSMDMHKVRIYTKDLQRRRRTSETTLENKRLRLRRLVSSRSFPTCLRRPNLFPCVGKDWGEKDAFTSKTAVTYLLCRQTHFFAVPFAYLKTKPQTWFAVWKGRNELIE